MANRLEIMNMALLYIGEEMIADGDESKNSDIANQFIDLCLETALSEHDWNFALKRSTLSYELELDGVTPVAPSFGYTYQYLLPSDYNHIVVIEGDEFLYREEYGYILTDLETLELTYIANIENYSILSPKFTDALVMLLASKMSYALTGSPQLGGTLEQFYEKKIAKARMQNSTSIGLEQEDDTWLEER